MTQQIIYVFVIILLMKETYGAKYTISNIKNCKTDRKLSITTIAHDRIHNGIQQFSANVTVLKDLDNDNHFRILVNKVLPNKLVKIADMKGKGACKAILDYGGAYYREIATKMKFADPTDCPKKGKYYLDWTGIDFNRVPMLKTVPNGKYHVTDEDYDDKNVIMCLEFMFEKSS